MIYKVMKGRLGNQMFQYASMRAMQLKNYPNERMFFCFKHVEKKGKSSEGFKNSLNDFNLENFQEVDNISCNFFQKILLIILSGILFLAKKIIKPQNFDIKRQKIECFIQKIYNFIGIYWFTIGYYPFHFKIRKRKVFYGYFESLQYFKEIKEDLQKEFTPKYKELEKNFSLYKIIESENSVCISIRRGDFLTNEIYKRRHFICDDKYFYKAIEIMSKKLKNPRFVIFSDDIEWVKQNMKFPENTIFEEGNDPVWEKLRLMYKCKHFIISNSTFSWWAQFLSRNNDKIVIAPRKWLNFGPNPDIYEKDWILID